MAFDTYDRSLDLIRTLAPLARKLATYDPTLARQLRDAASSVTQNLAEGSERRGKDRKAHFRYAHGSIAEVIGCLDLAVAWDYLDDAAVATARELAGRVRAMAYRLAA
jgi:four helix bundle protein